MERSLGKADLLGKLNHLLRGEGLRLNAKWQRSGGFKEKAATGVKAMAGTRRDQRAQEGGLGHASCKEGCQRTRLGNIHTAGGALLAEGELQGRKGHTYWVLLGGGREGWCGRGLRGRAIKALLDKVKGLLEGFATLLHSRAGALLVGLGEGKPGLGLGVRDRRCVAGGHHRCIPVLLDLSDVGEGILHMLVMSALGALSPPELARELGKLSGACPLGWGGLRIRRRRLIVKDPARFKDFVIKV